MHTGSQILSDLLRRRLDVAQRRRDRGDVLMHGDEGEVVWLRSSDCGELLPDGPIEMVAYSSTARSLVRVALSDERRKQLARALWPAAFPPAEETPAWAAQDTEPIDCADILELRRTGSRTYGGAGWAE